MTVADMTYSYPPTLVNPGAFMAEPAGDDVWYANPAFEADIIPSGSANRPLPPTRQETPTGSTRWSMYHIVPLTFPLAIVIFSGAGRLDGSVERASSNLDRSAAVAERIPLARRPGEEEDETPLDRGLAAPTVKVGSVSEVASTGVEASVDAGAVAITAADQVIGIQDALSLSVTQVAEIMEVSRATVYTWLKGEVQLPRDMDTTRRLRELHRLATLWRVQSSEHLGRLVMAPVGDTEPSLLALLTAPTWDMTAIEWTMRTLAERLKGSMEQQRVARSRGENRPRMITAENIEIERLRLRGLE